jgi:peptidoglycan/LPS O-acetylase OafA/YrhL
MDKPPDSARAQEVGPTVEIGMASNTRPAQLPALTGLRFLAALCVVISHGAHAMTTIGNPLWYEYCAQLSAFGMTLFFVLSGFVIHYNYSEQITEYRWRGIMNFFIARFARLYPLYIVAVVLVLYEQGIFLSAWEGDAAANESIKFALPFYLSMTQSWIYAVNGEYSLIYQYPSLQVMQISWSISTEWFFYMTYPFICILLTKLTRTHLIWVAWLTGVGALSIMAAAFGAVDAIDRFGEGHFGPVAALAHGDQDSFFRWLVFFAPYTRVPEFLLGCLVAAFYRTLQEQRPSIRERRAGRSLSYFALMIVIGLHLIMFSPSHPFPFLTFLHLNFGFAVPVALLLFGLTRYETILSRTLSCSWMVACGDASYSIYLLHELILPNAGLNILPVGQSFSLTSIMVMRMVVSIAVVIGFSLLTYRILECPARRFLRRLLSIPLRQPGSELTPTLVAG